jgi:hypothetical protein
MHLNNHFCLQRLSESLHKDYSQTKGALCSRMFKLQLQYSNIWGIVNLLETKILQEIKRERNVVHWFLPREPENIQKEK